MEKESDASRQNSLKAAARKTAEAAGLYGVTFLAHPERVFGANDRVRVAVCGLHGRGENHLEGYAQVPNVEVAALCDVDENVLNKRLKQLDGKPKTYVDVRKLLEDKSIDAISIATPNHWHTLMAIWGCQAGKDVYVEKPCSHNLWEGQQLVRAANKYKRMVQHGTQMRSASSMKEAVAKLNGGELGELYLGRGLCYKWRNTIGYAPEEPVPAGVHYDLWTGPAPLLPFTKNRFHYNWHWNWNTGNGDIGNQGVHQMDIVRWGMGVQYPNRVSAVGGHFMFDDDQQTPNTLNASFEFQLPGGKRKMIEFEVRHWVSNSEADIGRASQSDSERKSKHQPDTVGDLFYGPKGYMAIGNDDHYSYRTWLGDEHEPGPSGHGAGDHFANFADCVRSRRKEDLNAPAEEGAISCSLIHLANASYRLGRTLNFDPETQRVINDEEANNLLRETGRGYREPYVIPEKV